MATNEEKNSLIKAKSGKYLTFRLCNEEYGVEILKVQEIIGIMPVTRVPRMPSFVRGVINLRGKLIPIADMRMKFEMEHVEDTEKTCIIVVEVEGKGGKLTIGVTVDQVSEVLSIQSEQLDPPPTFGIGISTEFMLGMGKVGDKVVILLDIDKVLGCDETQALMHAVKSSQVQESLTNQK